MREPVSTRSRVPVSERVQELVSVVPVLVVPELVSPVLVVPVVVSVVPVFDTVPVFVVCSVVPVLVVVVFVISPILVVPVSVIVPVLVVSLGGTIFSLDTSPVLVPVSHVFVVSGVPRSILLAMMGSDWRDTVPVMRVPDTVFPVLVISHVLVISPVLLVGGVMVPVFVAPVFVIPVRVAVLPGEESGVMLMRLVPLCARISEY